MNAMLVLSVSFSQNPVAVIPKIGVVGLKTMGVRRLRLGSASIKWPCGRAQGDPCAYQACGGAAAEDGNQRAVWASPPGWGRPTSLASGQPVALGRCQRPCWD